MIPNRCARNSQGLIALCVVLLASFFGDAIHAATPAGDFPSLNDACRQLATHGKKSSGPIPSESPILAFEENAHFLYATADLSNSLPSTENVEKKPDSPTFVRRFLFLKPSIWIVEDRIHPKACKKLRGKVEQQDKLGGKTPPLLCQVLWPDKECPSSTKGAKCPGRYVRMFQSSPVDANATLAKAVLENLDGRFDLTITAKDRIYQIQFPEVGAGRIGMVDSGGKTLVPLRPLPSGVLPHGEKGMRLIDRWDRSYRDGQHPPWNSGMAAPDLREAVEKGHIKPCRVVVLGCGSGDNPIYLAKQGFDVTAIDLAPTALSIAESDAKKAGVQVRWLLADVLALPKFEPFDLIFDRGCYHNVRYVDAKGFIQSLDRISRPGTRFLVLSLDRDSAPGVREPTMRGDFSELFDFQWIRKSTIFTGKNAARQHTSWSVMLRKKGEKTPTKSGDEPERND